MRAQGLELLSFPPLIFLEPTLCASWIIHPRFTRGEPATPTTFSTRVRPHGARGSKFTSTYTASFLEPTPYALYLNVASHTVRSKPSTLCTAAHALQLKPTQNDSLFPSYRNRAHTVRSSLHVSLPHCARQASHTVRSGARITCRLNRAKSQCMSLPSQIFEPKLQDWKHISFRAGCKLGSLCLQHSL